MHIQPNYPLRNALRLSLSLLMLLPVCGCFSPWFNSNATDKEKRRERIKEVLVSDERPKILSEIAYDRMLTRSRLENVGLVTRLLGTGGMVKAGGPRERMLRQMRSNNAEGPNAFLDSEATAMVVATVEVPPAARKGDILDVSVTLSQHADASDLQRGWLLETPMVEMSRLGGQIREGFKFASAAGPIVTMAEQTGSNDPQAALTGRIIGGATLIKQRELGVAIQQEFADAVTMAAVLPEIRQRFTYFDGRKRTGIATPSDEAYIKLIVPQRYELDPFHFVNVVLNIGFNESSEERAERVSSLSRQLTEPTTVRAACWQLEAIGEEAIPVLAAALDSPNPEIQFYVAHALAYLDDKRAIEPLSRLCLQEPAFRAMCLNALTIIDHFESEDKLREMLHSADAETRYGAVRALRRKNPRDPQITGLPVAEAGKLLQVPSDGVPLVAVSLSSIPEVVIFGESPLLNLPEFEYVTDGMMLRAELSGEITITNFEPDQPDKIQTVQPDLASVLTGIAEAGGTYGNWVSFVRTCNEKGFMAEPIAMNPIPNTGRVYDRVEASKLEPGESMRDETIVNEIAADKSGDEDEEASPDRSWYNPFSW